MASKLTATRRLKKAGIRLLAVIAPMLYMGYMRLVAATSHIDSSALTELIERKDGGDDLVAAVLHQDIFLTPYVLRPLRALAFTNVGDAGDLMAAILQRCDFSIVRGGTSSRSSRRTPVVARIIEEVRSRRTGEGTIVGSAPDGSRGPAGAINAGLVLFSIRLGADVYCIRIQSKRTLYLKTWDRTAIPLPFTRIRVAVAGPFRMEEKPSSEAMERMRLAIEDAFHNLHRDGFRACDQEPVPVLSRMPPRAKRRRPSQESAP